MDYEFKNIESLIRDAIDSVSNSKTAFKEQFIQGKSAFSEEKIRAKKSFALKTLSFERKDQVTRFVQFHQQSLINFSDELFDGLSPRRESQLTEMSNFFVDHLNDLQNHIQYQYAEHFNQDTKAPEAFIADSLERWKEALDRIENCPSKGEMDQVLLSLPLMPVKNILLGRGQAINYRTLSYTTELLNLLHEVVYSDQDGRSIDEQIRSVLLHLNYNSRAYFEYYINHLKAQISATDAVSDQLEKLAYSYKVINQTPSKQCLTYDLQSKPLKNQLSDWLLEEIQYLERKRELVSKSAFNEEAFVRKEFKLEFDMSVAQFAYFIKAFVETGVIQNKNISELIRFLAKFVKTKRSESISYDSFRMKYYNVESNTKSSVRNLLHTAIGYINSN